MNKFELYQKAESVINSADKVGQLKMAISYTRQFSRYVKDKDLSHQLKIQMIKKIGKIQDKASGLSDLLALRSLLDEL